MTVGGRDSYNSAMRELGSIHETVKNIKEMKVTTTQGKTSDVNLKLERLYKANEILSKDIHKLENYYSSGFAGTITKLWHTVTGSGVKQAREDQKAINEEIGKLSKYSPTVNQDFEEEMRETINPGDLKDFQSYIPKNLSKAQYESATEKLAHFGGTISLSGDDEVVKDFVQDLFDPGVSVEDMESKVKDGLMVKDEFKAFLTEQERLTTAKGTRPKESMGETFVGTGAFENALKAVRKDQRGMLPTFDR